MTAPAAVRFLAAGGLEFPVIVSAGSRRSGVTGMHGEAVKVAVHAPPEKGRANAEVIGVVAAWLGIPEKAVAVLSGHTSRRKRIGVAGIGEALWRKRLAALAASAHGAGASSI